MVTVRCFASVREALGLSLCTYALERPMSAEAVLAAVAGERLSTLPTRPLVAINMQHGRLESLVHDGDELAFFPPVSGG
ncbi:MAG: MoaD/ThiS family protein [Gammaproteobacteria bacterium]|nr:MoaD/ThiS family protein [Gammaproteobacteria bacterium]